MRQLSGLVAILALLNLCQLHDAAITNFNQSFSYPEGKVYYNPNGIKDGIFVYAVCDDHRFTTERTCTVIQRVFPYDKEAHSCKITLQKKHSENSHLVDRPLVYAFGEENALFIYGEHGSNSKIEFMTIQMKNNCKTNVVELDDPEHLLLYRQISSHNIITYVHYFDMFIQQSKDKSHATIGTRVYVDDKREIEPIHTIIKSNEDNYFQFISPIAKLSPAKGYVYITMGPEHDHVVLAEPHGNQTVLSNTGRYQFVSANYDFVTLCMKSESADTTTCTQYDEYGKVKFQVTLDLDNKKSIAVVHNTPHGGFILVTKTDKSGDNEPKHLKDVHDIVRFDSNGKKVGSIPIEASGELFNVWESKDDEHCLTIGSQDVRGGKNVDIYVKCFAETDFTH